MQFRHGDLLLQSTSGVPAHAVKLPHRVLLEGEATGHAHRVDQGILWEAGGNGAEYWQAGIGERWLTLREPARLTHEEHRTLQVPAGCYRVVRQREYTSQGGIRKVED